MAFLSQASSFSSQSALTASQYTENSVQNPINGLRRVTIKQLLTAAETEGGKVFKIDGFPIQKVMLVANVFDVDSGADSSSGKIKYRLDDGTGRINGYRWQRVKGEPPIQNYAYARIVAQLDVYKNWRSLKISHVRPVHDGHEIYHHILHSIVDTLSLERGPPVYPPSNTETTSLEVHSLAQVFDRLDILTSEDDYWTGETTDNDESPVAKSSMIPEHTATSNPTPSNEKVALQQDVIEILMDKETDEDLGVHISEFIPELVNRHPTLTPTQLSEALEVMLDRQLITVANDEYYQVL